MGVFNSKDFNLNFGTSGIRGLVSDFSFQATYYFVVAFTTILKPGLLTTKKIVLGHDLRPSSPFICADAAKAIKDSNFEYIYVGSLPTPAIAFYAQKIGSPAVIVTGSHIPFDRNGIKLYRSNGEISKADELAITQSQISIPDEFSSYELSEVDNNAYQVYLNRYLDFFGDDCLNGKRIALYEHSSVARDLLKELLFKLGAEVISLGRTDSFVPIDTEAVRQEDVKHAQAWAKEHQFDAILSTDGDADRPLIGDERGQWLRGDIVGVLCAKYLKADAVVTPVSSNTAVEKSGWFTTVTRTKIGSPYVIAEMEKCDVSKEVVVGFEANGGFLLGSDLERNGKKLERLPTRDALLPMLAILAMSRDVNCKVSELNSLLPARFTFSDRIQNFSSERSAQLLSDLNLNSSTAKKLMGDHLGEIISLDLTDGYQATFASGDIVHLRPSGNAPELRCYVEASTEEYATKLCNNCLDAIQKLPA